MLIAIQVFPAEVGALTIQDCFLLTIFITSICQSSNFFSGVTQKGDPDHLCGLATPHKSETG